MAMVSDHIFVYAISFVLSLAWSKYFIKDDLICLFTALALSAFVGYVYGFKAKKRSLNATLIKRQRKELDALRLRLLSDKNAVLTIGDMFVKQGFEVTFLGNCIVAKNENKTLAAAVCFSTLPLCSDRLLPALDVIKRFKATELYVFCCKYSPENPELPLPKDVELKVFDMPHIKTLFDNLGIRLDSPEVVPKKAFFPKLSKLLCRSRSSYYFWSGITLLVTGYISFFPLYYAVAATLSLSLALYSRFNTRFNGKPHFIIQNI